MNSHVTSRWTTLIFVAATLFAVTPQNAFGQASQYQRSKRQGTEKKKTQQAPKGDKVDISDLEKKYWAPKDTDFSVVQNRAYTKEKRVSVSLLGGPVLNDLWSEGINYNLSVNYFFSERHGVELSYMDGSGLSDSDAIDHFKQGLSGGGVLPDYGRITSYYGVNYNWVPFYAKMSLLGKKIIYFDMLVSPGLGMTNYTKFSKIGNKSDSSITFNLDISQYFFIKNNFAIRLDYKNRWYKEEIVNWNSGAKTRDENRNRSYILFGATYFY